MTMLVRNLALTAHANAIRKLGKQTIENVIEIGRHLVEAKAEVKKLGGSWGDWLKHEFEWKTTSADRFMSVYDRKSELTNLVNADLPVSALYLLAAPTTSKEARDEVAARVKSGRKVKHKEVAAVVKKHKSKERKPLSGVGADVEAALKAAGSKGLTTDELKVKFAGKHNPQTVNSATNSLAKKDRIRDNGEKRQGREAGGRPSIVYVYNPDPQPTKSTAKQSADIHSFSDHKLVAMIEDESICTALKLWAEGKTPEQKASKAHRLSIPLVGDSGKSLGLIIRARNAEWERTGKIIGTLELKM